MQIMGILISILCVLTVFVLLFLLAMLTLRLNMERWQILGPTVGLELSNKGLPKLSLTRLLKQNWVKHGVIGTLLLSSLKIIISRSW